MPGCIFAHFLPCSRFYPPLGYESILLYERVLKTFSLIIIMSNRFPLLYSFYVTGESGCTLCDIQPENTETE